MSGRKPTQAYLSYLTSAKWKAKRKQVIARCNGVCERCQQRQVRNIHHKHYDTLGDEPLSDLLGVCRPCHREIHGLDKVKQKKRYRKGSKRKKRNELRLKALRIGVPPQALKPFKNPPLPPKTDWSFRDRLLKSLDR